MSFRVQKEGIYNLSVFVNSHVSLAKRLFDKLTCPPFFEMEGIFMMGLLLCICLPVFHRTDAFCLTETLGKIAGRGKTQNA